MHLSWKLRAKLALIQMEIFFVISMEICAKYVLQNTQAQNSYDFHKYCSVHLHRKLLVLFVLRMTNFLNESGPTLQ